MCRRLQVGVAVLAVSSAAHALVLNSALGAITATGLVAPDPTSGGDQNQDLEIGVGSNPEDVDPRATVRVDGGSLLEFDQVFVGSDEGFFGRMYVTGDGTVMRLYDGGNNTSSAIEVGREGNGYLEVTNGAYVDLVSTTSDMAIGRAVGSVGEMIVRDPLTFLTLDEDILVGDAGIGTMSISGGALVRTTDTDSDLIIGNATTGYGVLTVDGHLTTLQLGGNMTVGGMGIGALHVTGGARVDANNALAAQAAVGVLGRVVLDDGTLDVVDVNVDGYLGGAGIVRGQVDVGEDGAVEARPGDLLSFHGVVNNQGAVTVTGGELRFENVFANNAQGVAAAPGRVTLENGTVRFSQALTNDGVISSADGASNLHGEITNQGTIVVASDTVATFNDSVTDNGGTITVLARGNALFLADLTFQAASAVLLSVGLEDTTDNSAQIGIAGALTLAGELMIDVDANYTPMLGETFEMITAGGGVVGTFDTTTLPDIPGNLEFGILYDATSVMMEVRLETMSIDLPGDYNGNGIVDAADYTVWRDNLGTAFDLGGNGDETGSSAGVVDQADYDFWKAHFGDTAGAGSGTARHGGSSTGASPSRTAAPEPDTLALLLIAAGLLVGCRPLPARHSGIRPTHHGGR